MNIKRFIGTTAVGVCMGVIGWAADGESPHVPADEPAPRDDDNSRIAHEQLLEKAKQGKIDVYFIGDSITRRWGATDYPKLLAHWNETFHGWNAANFAWGGDRTQNILWRLEHGEMEGVSPKVIVIQAGTNNLSGRPGGDQTVADITRGIQAIVEKSRGLAPEATIILTAIFPRNDDMRYMPTIRRINMNIERFAEDEGGEVRFVNINDNLADEQGRLRPGMAMSDKLHLDLGGYKVWAEALKPILREELGPPAETDHAPPPTGDPAAEGQGGG